MKRKFLLLLCTVLCVVLLGCDGLVSRTFYSEFVIEIPEFDDSASGTIMIEDFKQTRNTNFVTEEEYFELKTAFPNSSIWINDSMKYQYFYFGSPYLKSNKRIKINISVLFNNEIYEGSVSFEKLNYYSGNKLEYYKDFILTSTTNKDKKINGLYTYQYWETI